MSDLIIRKEWRQVLGVLAMVLLMSGLGGGIGFEISRKGSADQLKDEGDLKQRGDNVPEELECVGSKMSRQQDSGKPGWRGASSRKGRESRKKDVRKESTTSNQRNHYFGEAQNSKTVGAVS